MTTYFNCTNCNTCKRSKFDAGCYGKCGKRDCRDCCETCGNHTLVSAEVAKIGNQLGLRQNNEILPILQRMKNEVDHGDKQYFQWTIEQRTAQGYCGPAVSLVYHRGGLITKHTLNIG